jgi:hypothetical protein
MKTYTVQLQLSVAECWAIDGLTASTIKRRIKEELPHQLCPFMSDKEIIISKIIVKVKK